MLREQAMAVEVEIPHQRRVDSHGVELIADMRYRQQPLQQYSLSHAQFPNLRAQVPPPARRSLQCPRYRYWSWIGPRGAHRPRSPRDLRVPSRCCGEAEGRNREDSSWKVGSC
jgi:hypothetical protein